MEIKVSITPEIKGLLEKAKADVQAGIEAGMTNLAAEIEARAVKNTPVRTSNLVNTITNFLTNGRGRRIAATAPYAAFVHEGTGLYGSHHQLIFPKKAKALKIPGIGYRKSTKGMEGRPFFNLALKGLDTQKVFDEGIQNFLRKRGW